MRGGTGGAGPRTSDRRGEDLEAPCGKGNADEVEEEEEAEVGEETEKADGSVESTECARACWQSESSRTGADPSIAGTLSSARGSRRYDTVGQGIRASDAKGAEKGDGTQPGQAGLRIGEGQ